MDYLTLSHLYWCSPDYLTVSQPNWCSQDYLTLSDPYICSRDHLTLSHPYWCSRGYLCCSAWRAGTWRPGSRDTAAPADGPEASRYWSIPRSHSTSPLYRTTANQNAWNPFSLRVRFHEAGFFEPLPLAVGGFIIDAMLFQWCFSMNAASRPAQPIAQCAIFPNR